MGKVKISGVGCCLLDYLYSNIDFNGPQFSKYLSAEKGDGGLSPGRLVFTEELEKFSKRSIKDIMYNLVSDSEPDKYNLGGPAIVALIHAAQLLNDTAEVDFYAAIGEDTIGERIIEIIDKTPVRLAMTKKSPSPSPFTYVLSDPDYNEGHGERTFINNIGAAKDILPEDLDKDFFQSEITVFGGTAIVPAIHENLLDLLTRAKQSGAVTIVNTVFDFKSEKSAPGMKWPLGSSDDSYRHIDILIMDMEEALKLSGQPILEEACKFFRDSGVDSFIITNGADPITLFSRGNLFKPQSVTSLPVSEAVLNEIKHNTGLAGDTTGCGDNFVGGIIASTAWQIAEKNNKALDLIEACSWGIASGGFACFIMGGTYIQFKPGEKLNLVKPYFELYRDQISHIR
jgi:sugar/nucleoside kinase (ribokinase family)